MVGSHTLADELTDQAIHLDAAHDARHVRRWPRRKDDAADDRHSRDGRQWRSDVGRLRCGTNAPQEEEKEATTIAIVETSFSFRGGLLPAGFWRNTLLAIRLMRTGAKKRPSYRIVVKEKQSKRDGSYLENLGTYNPTRQPAEINLKTDRIQYWIEKGAQPTDTVRQLIKQAAKLETNAIESQAEAA